MYPGQSIELHRTNSVLCDGLRIATGPSAILLAMAYVCRQLGVSEQTVHIPNRKLHTWA